ncbi:MAG: protocatechuate 3,4-dioxygenase subunit alpha [Microbacterium sp.]|uniref:protocatechuate 3,4-dioxygenase subunit alpha n=1 Tax=Microbacterium sp. TaxID=51671 RepID=UPI001AD1E10F|nr:protocatechuate 3,4-dioxygenase subunit alpha [Microbacterium sp.]MBN9168443.1 protocatechuate 3,4-dioxygenase subunit alpha [Microbacterium sp.]MBN9180929.1 protocatechuate 3,4-dioxygenase subunit alpha [Microbacterium sp.]MBN9183359.1 protocatechuate 3,4-dioxygenase subunit alpha [Microbacterium sp.]MBN9184023.1 protocatechuate 3,4-dioxygenase subunit alpha [Microbacterium sp.]MBN9189140.1 protocatechuate 3,4-dioxygenase subunit alpha [Microbacterium sp.]
MPDKTLSPTPGQTVGPFFAYGTIYPKMHEVAHPHSPGAIVLGGTVYDGAGAPIPDSLVEIWGADTDGTVSRARGAFRRDDHTFTGFGRSFTTDEGHYEFWTRNPGAEAGKAPFFAVVVFARGLPDKLHTRIYLPDDEELLAADPLLSSLDADERATLIATRLPDGSLTHDIRLQGEKETVFLAF